MRNAFFRFIDAAVAALNSHNVVIIVVILLQLDVYTYIRMYRCIPLNLGLLTLQWRHSITTMTSSLRLSASATQIKPSWLRLRASENWCFTSATSRTFNRTRFSISLNRVCLAALRARSRSSHALPLDPECVQHARNHATRHPSSAARKSSRLVVDAA